MKLFFLRSQVDAFDRADTERCWGWERGGEGLIDLNFTVPVLVSDTEKRAFLLDARKR